MDPNEPIPHTSGLEISIRDNSTSKLGVIPLFLLPDYSGAFHETNTGPERTSSDREIGGHIPR